MEGLFHLREMESTDSSLNGLQVANSHDRVERIAFAVDACLESFARAAEWGADLLFVHHGLFWGKPLAVRDGHYRRLRALLQSDCALFAVHLPLDLHPELGNNAGLCRLLGLQALEPFGEYKGVRIGFKGTLPEGKRLEELVRQLVPGPEAALGVLPFGPEEIHTVAVVSGGAAHEALQAIEEGVDLYVTGDAAHTLYHECLEGQINVIFGGHYRTEVWGVRQLAERLAAEHGLETTFLDIPTGL